MIDVQRFSTLTGALVRDDRNGLESLCGIAMTDLIQRKSINEVAFTHCSGRSRARAIYSRSSCWSVSYCRNCRRATRL